MRRKQDTNLNKNIEDLKFELIDDLLIYDILLRKRPI
jgi:hypothetical protein